MSIIPKKFKIDYSKVESLEQVIDILKAMDSSIHWYNDNCPEQFKDLYEKGNYDAMRYLLKNYKYSRYAISMWYRVLSDGAPTDIHNILQDYHDSAMATL